MNHENRSITAIPYSIYHIVISAAAALLAAAGWLAACRFCSSDVLWLASSLIVSAGMGGFLFSIKLARGRIVRVVLFLVFFALLSTAVYHHPVYGALLWSDPTNVFLFPIPGILFVGEAVLLLSFSYLFLSIQR